MTAYGRGESSLPIGKITVEVTSLNSKRLEIKVSLPNELSYLEADVRNWITPHLGRGTLSIRISADWKGKPPHAATLNHSLLQHYLDEGKKFQEKTSLDLPSTFWVNWALQQGGIFSPAESNQDGDLRLLLEQALQAAFRPFLEMKLREGAALAIDLKRRIEKISTEVEIVKSALSLLIPKLHEKMERFLTPYFKESLELEERVLREIALLAKSSDYTEEVIRLAFHLEQALMLVSGEEVQVGKTFEFILQEIQRELNTLGAKAQDLEVSKRVVMMKSELEKMREQIQNVE